MAKSLILSHCSLAKVEQLFNFKEKPLKLSPFPGYQTGEWGIKSHNRQWVVNNGRFASGHKILDVGGGYSTLVKYLIKKYPGLQGWIGDDFSEAGTMNWEKWGNPRQLPSKNHPVKYIYSPLGIFSADYRDNFFDRIFSISTMEHVPFSQRLKVFQDIHRCLKPRGMVLHTIDIQTELSKVLFGAVLEKTPLHHLYYKLDSQIGMWLRLIEKSGVEIKCDIPNSFNILAKNTLVEDYEIYYKYYEPKNKFKLYLPPASLLLIIESHE